jgi:hypothetical protein
LFSPKPRCALARSKRWVTHGAGKNALEDEDDDEYEDEKILAKSIDLPA